MGSRWTLFAVLLLLTILVGLLVGPPQPSPTLTSETRIDYGIDRTAEVQSALADRLSEGERVRTIIRNASGTYVEEVDRERFDELVRTGSVERAVVDQPISLFTAQALETTNIASVRRSGLSGQGARICVVDTGVSPSILDGISYEGWNVLTSTDDVDDGHGHGTQVAYPLISAAPGASYVFVKAIDNNGIGYESDVLKALDECEDRGADVISLSIGSGLYDGLCDANIVAERVNELVSSGTLVVAAAGNEGGPLLKSPACASSATAVIASDGSQLWSGSSYLEGHAVLAAPGADIATLDENGNTVSASGTSMATPFVSGAAALLLENTTHEPLEIRKRLASSGRFINESLAFARLDLDAALRDVVTSTLLGGAVQGNGSSDGIVRPLALAYAYPDGDVSTGSWVTTPLWSKVDEEPADDSDYITSTGDNIVELSFSDVVDPQNHSDHWIRIRWRRDATGGNNPCVGVDLYQGATPIRDIPGGLCLAFTTWDNVSFLLTEAEAANITNYSDLRIRVDQFSGGSGKPADQRFVEVSWVRLELPAPAPLINVTANQSAYESDLEEINVSGYLTRIGGDPISSANVTVSTYNSTPSLVNETNVTTDGSGYYEHTWVPTILANDTWTVNVTYTGVDESAENSTTFNVTYVDPTPTYSKFDGSTTNFSAEGDLQNVAQPILEIATYGRIRWYGTLNVEYQNYDTGVYIQNRSISVAVPPVSSVHDSRANITFKGFVFTYTPVILRDGSVCSNPDCNVTSSSPEFNATVAGFSNYTLNGNSNLSVFDGADPAGGSNGYDLGNQVPFYANYTNITSGAVISSGSCDVRFNNGTWGSYNAMTYNSSSQLYEYNRSFASSSAVTYEANCSASGYESITAQDTYSSYVVTSATIDPSPLAFSTEDLLGYCNASSATQRFDYEWILNGTVEYRGSYLKPESLSVGGLLACGIRANDSRVLCWGDGGNGALGTNSTTDQSVPTLTSDSSAYAQVSVGSSSVCGIRASDSRVLCWGYNGYGAIGDGTWGTNRLVPTLTSDSSAYAQVSVGSSSVCGIRANDSRVLCWGRANYGALGTGGTGSESCLAGAGCETNPTLTSDASAYASLEVGEGFVCGIRANDSRVLCWGHDGDGELGSNKTAPDNCGLSCSLDPMLTFDSAPYRLVDAGDNAACGIRANDSRVLCWGRGGSHLGINDSGFSDQPVPAVTLDESPYVSVTLADVAGSGTPQVCGIRANDSRVLCWSGNFFGQIGDNTTTNRLVPTLTADPSPYLAIGAAEYHSCGIRASDSRVLCWGQLSSGSLGNGSLSGADALVPQLTSDNASYYESFTNEQNVANLSSLRTSLGDEWQLACRALGGGLHSATLNSTKTTIVAPLDSCQVINTSGTYKMDQDVSSAGTCFTINASDVSLDCAGYTTNYSQSGSGSGILIEDGVSNVTVANCILAQGSSSSTSPGVNIDGLVSSRVSNVTIDNVTISTSGQSADGVYSNYGTNVNVTNSNITIGSTTLTSGIYYRFTENGTIENMTFVTGDETIRMREAHGTVIREVQSDSSAPLLLIQDSNNVLAEYVNGTMDGSLGHGFYFQRSNHSIVRHSTSVSSGSDGHGIVFLEGAQNNTVLNVSATASGSPSVGLFVEISDNNTVINSTFSGATHDVYLNMTYGGVYVVNSSFNDANVGLDSVNVGYLHRGWYVDLYANDTNGNPVSANINYTDSGDAPSVNPSSSANGLTTATDGYLRDRILYEYSENNTARYHHTNYTFNVTNASYDPLTGESRNFTTNTQLTFTFNAAGGDTTNPTWSGNATNETGTTPRVGENITMNVTLSDETQLDTYTFSWNDSGAWVNDSVTDISGTEFNVSVSKSVTSTRGDTVAWRVYFNDTSGNTNVTNVFTFTVKNTAPGTPSLDQPADDSSTADTTPLFNWTSITDADGDTVTYQFYLSNDSGFTQIVESDTNVAVNSYTSGTLNETTYWWRVSSYDGFAYSSNATAFNVTITADETPIFTKFDGSTTNFSNEGDLSSVSQPILDILPFGRIKWNGVIDARNADYDANVNIINGSIFVDAAALHSSHNSSANLSFNATRFRVQPVLYKDGVICSSPSCNVTSFEPALGRLNVTVAGFSNYTLGNNSNLSIWDGADSEGGSNSYFVNDQVPFYANYTNITSGLPINDTGDACTVEYDTGSGYGASNSMSFNTTILLYEYNRSFTSNGTFTYRVNCTSTNGYENLSVTDTVTIQLEQQEWSVSAWVNVTSGAAGQYLVDGINRGLVLVDSAGRIVMDLADGYNATTSPNLLNGQGWTHVVFVYRESDSYRKIYVNTVDETIVNGSGTPTGLASQITIRPGLVGSIDSFVIYDRVLNATEVSSLYNASTQYETNFTNLSDGTYTIKASAVDEAGNRNETEQRTFTISTSSSPPTWSNNVTNETGTTPRTTEFITMNVTLSDDVALDTYTFSWNDSGTWVNDSVTSISGTEFNVSVSKQVTSTRGDTVAWRVYFNDSDGLTNVTDVFTFTVKNTPPAVPVLDEPLNDTSTIDRTPLFNWTASDADGDTLTYNISIECLGGCAVDDRNATVSDANYTSTTLNYFADDGYTYRWRVLACDGFNCSAYSAYNTFNITTFVSINFTTASIDFSNLDLGVTNGTDDDDPLPFVLQNTGNAPVNITIYAIDSFFERASLPSSFYRVAARTGGDFVSANLTYVNMPASGSPHDLIRGLNYTGNASIDIEVTVPLDEPPGAKNSTAVAVAVLA